MAYTAPRTWVVGEIVTAAICNTHIRDNLLETAPAKVTTAGDMLYATGANALARLGLAAQGNVLISNNAANSPAWTTSLDVGTGGEVTAPDTPAFLAYNSVADTNMTGDATTVSPVEFDTEVFDQGSDYDNATDTFTAPVAGRYRFHVQINSGCGAAHTTYRLTITTSNRAYGLNINGGAVANGSGRLVIGFSCLADMDASDTAVVTCQVSGGAKTVDFTNVDNYFSGQLEC